MRGRPFERGNKVGRGRPRGSRNKSTLFQEAMQKNGLALIQQCQVLALKGDTAALRLCIERLLPPCKSQNGRFRMPVVRESGDLVKAMPAVMEAVAAGKLSAQDGQAIGNMLEYQRRAFEAQEFEKRLRTVEQAMVNHSDQEGAGASDEN